jgi:hypothetical protein
MKGLPDKSVFALRTQHMRALGAITRDWNSQGGHTNAAYTCE